MKTYFSFNKYGVDQEENFKKILVVH